MKKMISVMAAMVICLMSACAFAGGWTVPGGNSDSGYSDWSGISAQLIEDLATRSGPSTTYTGCGSYKMKGQYVTVLSRAYDNGGVLWVEVEFSYGGGYRRAWTGAKRLNISSSALARIPEIDMNAWLGYGTISRTVSPRFGPGTLYATYGDRDFHRGDQVAVIRYDGGYCLVERYHSGGNILRCWVPASDVD